MSAPAKWREEWNGLLGTKIDALLAAELGVCRKTVQLRRISLGIACCAKKQVGRCADCRKPVRRKAILKLMLCRRCKYERQLARSRGRHQRNKVLGVERPSWAAANPERRRKWAKKYRLKNLEKIRRYQRRWAKQQYLKNKALLKALPCLTCGELHSFDRRAALIRRRLPATVAELRQSRPCLWGDPSDADCAGAQMIYRDLKKIGAARQSGTFYLPAETRTAA